MRVLVTGGAGWIGRALVRELDRRGHDPVVYDVRSGGDVTEPLRVASQVAAADHVIHLAGLLGTHELFDRPHAAVDVNVHGALNVARACARHDRPLVKVTMPFVNPSVYAATHECAFRLAEAYRHARGLRVAYVRPFNAYGPGQPHGEGHPQKIIPTFATCGWAGEPIPVWGDGCLPVDLVHVDDVARVLADAMGYTSGETFDAGTGTPRTVTEVAELVRALTGSHSEILQLPARPGERAVSTPDDVAQGAGWDLLGWKPAFDPARLATAVESYRP